MRDYALAQWRRAQVTLISANQLVETDPDSAASRAYYAAFHAVTALLALRGQSHSKHSAVRAALHRDLVNTGQWSEELGDAYDSLMEMREIGDYGGIADVTIDGARTAVEWATALVKAVNKACPELAAPDSPRPD